MVNRGLLSGLQVSGLAATAILVVGGLAVNDRLLDPDRLLPVIVPTG